MENMTSIAADAFKRGVEFERDRILDWATCDIIVGFKPIIEYTIKKKFNNKKLVVSSKVLKEIKYDTGYSIDSILGYIRNAISDMVGDKYRVSYNRSFKEYRFILIISTQFALEGIRKW